MILVVDVGTSGVRSAVVTDDASIVAEARRELLPDTPFPGLVEFDATVMAEAVLETAREVLATAGPVAAVGVTNQRASTIVWDRATGVPVGPALGWQDLRTVGDCLVWQGEGLRFAPNQSVTKLAHLLDAHDPGRERDLCFGTVDSWIVWQLSAGALHVTDASNATIVTGLTHDDRAEWSTDVLATLGIPESVLPTIVDSSGIVGEATALPGSPPIAGMVGDQQSSLVGQGCVRPGLAKITFGTGGMLDTCIGPERPGFGLRGDSGSFPILAWQATGEPMWGIEALMLSAGTNVEWLRDDLGLISTPAESHDLAGRCESTDGVVYVPALLGLGTPHIDYGARSGFFGITRGTEASHMVRAVLEGVAHRGADLVEAAEADTGLELESIRVDGGMSANPTFVQALADACARPVELAPVTECTTLGAGFLAGLAVGTWAGFDEIAATWQPRAIIEPGTPLDRDRWREAVARVGHWHEDLSALSF